MSLGTCLKYDQHCILWQPPLGQPDPENPSKRLLFPGGESHTPAIDAFKNTLFLLSEEAYEVFANLEKKLSTKEQVFNPALRKFLIDKILTSQHAKSVHPLIKKIIVQTIMGCPEIQKLNQEEADVVESFILLYKSQHMNFKDSFEKFENIERITRGYRRFLAEKKISVDELVSPTLFVQTPSPALEKFKTEVAVKFYFAQMSGYRTSSWDPTKDVEVLYHELKDYGVMVIGGIFPIADCLNVSKPGFVLSSDKKKGKRAYNLKDDLWELFDKAVQAKEETSCCYITVVGVKKTRVKNTDHDVIFTIPWERSDPQRPDLLKYYAIPYRFFQRLVTTNYEAFYYDQKAGIEKFERRTGKRPTFGYTCDLSPEIRDFLLAGI